MKTGKFSLIVLLLLPLSGALAWQRSFDMGTADSPLEEGWTRVTQATVYDNASGFGWTQPCEGSFYRDKVSTKIIEGDPGPVVVDGVTDPEEGAFRVDLPDGKYVVEILLGDLGGQQQWAAKIKGFPGGPVYSMEVTVNGEVASTDVNAYTIGDRRSPNTFLGGVTKLLLEAEASEGKLLIRFRGNDSAHQKRVETNSAIPLTAKQQDLIARGVDLKRPPMMWLGEPYDHFSVLAIRIAAGTLDGLQPLKLDDWRLAAPDQATDSPLHKATDAYNAVDLAQATAEIDALQPADASGLLIKGYLYMAVAAHPRTDDEQEVAAKAIEPFQKALALDPALIAAELFLQDARNFAEGVRNFNRLGYGDENSSTNQFRGEALFRKIPPSSPLYLKSQVYRARIYGSQDPARWTWMWPEARMIMKRIEPDFNQNRYVKYYLSKEAMGGIARMEGPLVKDDIRATATGDWREDWDIPDYTEGTENAPDWAVQLREAYCRLIDLSEWWIRNRQIATGEIGGGFGDDVEIVALWGYIGFISKQAAPYAIEGATRMVDGIWYSEAIDPDNGYWNGPVTWVKIPAEFTGYSHPMMMAIEYGNPEYYERIMKTIKTMRDFGTYVNKNGRRHFRTGYFNSSRHSGDPLQRIDPALAWRCMFGASWLSWYSRNRSAEKLMSDWADAWLEVSIGTAKGKPKGVVPAILSSETDEPGAPNSPNWYDAPPPNNRGDYIFPSYTRYIHNLFVNMYLKTGREEFLEPLRITLKMAQEGKDIQWNKQPQGSEGWIKGLLAAKVQAAAGQSAAQLHKMAAIREFDSYIESMAGMATDWENFLITGDFSQIAAGLKNINQKLRDGWPMMTTDVALTDKIVPGGLIPAIASYIGGFGSTYGGFPGFTVSYENMTRNFAALVRETTSEELKILFFNFEPESREIAILPWALAVGASYTIEAGPDADNDQKLDEIAYSKGFILEHRADPVPVEIPSRQSWIVEIKQLRPPRERKPLADLGISQKDIWYRAHGESAIHVTVHNIGDAPAREITVAVYQGQAPDESNLVGRALIGHIAAPNDLDPQMVRVSVLYKPTTPEQTFTIVVDPEDEFPEITERNNTIVKTIRFADTQ